MQNRKISSALISVYNKEGLDIIVKKLHELNVKIYTTGGTQTFIESLGIPVERVEDLTGYPSILGGRVKTLHPKVFGGILAIRSEDHRAQLLEFGIPEIDLVIVDLYPFEDTVASTNDDAEIIEKIDIGGISLIRAAAKNFEDVVVVASKDQYPYFLDLLQQQGASSTIDQRKYLATCAFMVSSHYDTSIFKYFASDAPGFNHAFKESILKSDVLRYGENPHQEAVFCGNLDQIFDKLCGKELSYNNLVDIDAAIRLISEFKKEKPTFAIIKHTNACGVAMRDNKLDAWKAALEADPISAFGGILISNTKIDLVVANEIDKIFYEVLIAPEFDQDALDLLSIKSKRVILRSKDFEFPKREYKSLLNGVIVQDSNIPDESISGYVLKTEKSPTAEQYLDLEFAMKCAKHLKSNTIVLVKDNQMLGMGCGQTSRIDACNQAIEKAHHHGLDLDGAVMASDAFFPFPDCVEVAYNAGIKAVIQPGGSIKDQLSIGFCNQVGISMVFTGIRHFKH